MSHVPMRFMRVTYVYTFRFLNMPKDLLGIAVTKKPKISGADYEEVEWNSGEGFQPWLQMRTDAVVHTGTKDIPWDWYQETERRHDPYGDISRHLVKEMPHYEIVDYSDEEEPYSPRGLRVALRRSISLDRNGIGSCCISVILHAEALSKDVHGLPLGQCLSLLNQAEDSVSGKATEKNREKECSNVCMCRRFALKPAATNSASSAMDSLSLAQLAGRDILEFQSWLSGLTKQTGSIRWLCRDGDGLVVTQPLLATEAVGVGSETIGVPVQNPYVYVEMECSSLDAYHELTRRGHDSCGRNCLKDVLPHMLIRVGPTGLNEWGLNPDYLAAEGVHPDHGHFASVYPADYLHIMPHFRSTLVVFPPLDAEETRSQARAICRFLLAIRDTVLEARSRWHFLVSQHAHIDALIRHLESSWHGDDDDRKSFSQVQERLLQVRFDTTFIMENPIVFRRAASSLNTLYRTLENAFGSTEMESGLMTKLAHTMNIFGECMRINLTSQRRS